MLEHEKLYFWHVIYALVYEWATNYDSLCFFDGVELIFLWDLDQKALSFLSVKKKRVCFNLLIIIIVIIIIIIIVNK